MSVVMDENAVNRAIKRIAHEIVEHNRGTKDLAIIGIQRRGVPLAARITEYISKIEESNLLTGILDITLYRDDLSMLSEHPIINGSDINFTIEGKTIVLVDDVLFTGRTIRSAIEAILEIGRPKCIQLAVLIDRGHRELPIRADYVGKNVPTALEENIKVHVPEIDGNLDVCLERK
ncbi:MAG: bifunctional pyr operon transcriptional regulator/uracil phosphoribosyltransferase PyrR [Clostridia bacterium]|nr:bifunctional pyr operon transcriptional regulator/uracil phosphoribosyltransferase PyrR [Clostridia bacterium]